MIEKIKQAENAPPPTTTTTQAALFYNTQELHITTSLVYMYG